MNKKNMANFHWDIPHVHNPSIKNAITPSVPMTTLRIQVCPKEGIIPKILLWGWDWNPQSSSREGSGFLGQCELILECYHGYLSNSPLFSIKDCTPEHVCWVFLLPNLLSSLIFWCRSSMNFVSGITLSNEGSKVSTWCRMPSSANWKIKRSGLLTEMRRSFANSWYFADCSRINKTFQSLRRLCQAACERSSSSASKWQ